MPPPELSKSTKITGFDHAKPSNHIFVHLQAVDHAACARGRVSAGHPFLERHLKSDNDFSTTSTSFFSPPVMLSPGCFPEAHDFEPFKFPTVASSDPYWGDSSVFATGPLLNLVGPEGKNARDSTAACGSESSHLRGWDLSHPTEAAFYPHRAFLSDSSGCLAPSLFLNLDGLIGPSSSPVHGTQPGSFLVMPDTSTPPGDGVFSGEDEMSVPEPADLIKLEPFNDPEPFIQESEPLVEPKLRKRRLDGPPRYLACFFCRLRKIRCLPEEGTSVCIRSCLSSSFSASQQRRHRACAK